MVRKEGSQKNPPNNNAIIKTPAVPRDTPFIVIRPRAYPTTITAKMQNIKNEIANRTDESQTK